MQRIMYGNQEEVLAEDINTLQTLMQLI